MGQKRISRLEEQILRLEKMLGRLGGLEDEALPLPEQLKVIEVVGRSAVRLAILIQTQQEIECAIWYEEDRLYQREFNGKVAEQEAEWRERHCVMEEKYMKARIDERRMKMLKHAGLLPKKGTPEAEHPPGLEM
jgi:hypothetical protein